MIEQPTVEGIQLGIDNSRKELQKKIDLLYKQREEIDNQLREVIFRIKALPKPFMEKMD